MRTIVKNITTNKIGYIVDYIEDANNREILAIVVIDEMFHTIHLSNLKVMAECSNQKEISIWIK
jgi:hypothetical protein